MCWHWYKDSYLSTNLGNDENQLKLHAFLTSALNAGELSASRFCHFTFKWNSLYNSLSRFLPPVSSLSKSEKDTWRYFWQHLAKEVWLWLTNELYFFLAMRSKSYILYDRKTAFLLNDTAAADDDTTTTTTTTTNNNNNNNNTWIIYLESATSRTRYTVNV